jgi:hypothetical protein
VAVALITPTADMHIGLLAEAADLREERPMIRRRKPDARQTNLVIDRREPKVSGSHTSQNMFPGIFAKISSAPFV